MSDLQVFANPEFGEIRTVEIGGEPWLVGKDVAVALGYEKPTDAVRKHVDREDRGVSKIETPSGTQDMTIINESGLYSLILSSKLPGAKKFKRWVTSEVLPAIRRTGSYHAPVSEAELLVRLAQANWAQEHIKPGYRRDKNNARQMYYQMDLSGIQMAGCSIRDKARAAKLEQAYDMLQEVSQ